jgi:hypothetical protein
MPFGKHLHSIFHSSKHEESLLNDQKPGSQGSMGNDIPGTNLVELILPLTGGGTETLIVPNDHVPRDQRCPSPEHWHFSAGTRKASAAAADTGDTPKGASDVEKAEFILLSRQTAGMTPDEVKEFLEKRGVVDGFDVMKRKERHTVKPKGESAGSYYVVTAADSGAF